MVSFRLRSLGAVGHPDWRTNGARQQERGGGCSTGAGSVSVSSEGTNPAETLILVSRTVSLVHLLECLGVGQWELIFSGTQ